MRFVISAFAACLALPAYAAVPERGHQYDTMEVTTYPVHVTLRASGREFYGAGTIRFERRKPDVKPRRNIEPKNETPHGPDANLAERARAYVGQTAAEVGVRRSLWCAAFVNKITGGGTGSDLARSWLSKPRVAPAVGAIAVLSRGRGGHVGVVSGFDGHGNPIIISGNHAGPRGARRVGIGTYPRARVLAYVSA